MTHSASYDRATSRRMCQWYRAACGRVRRAGYRVSAGSWIDLLPGPGSVGGACVFSVEGCGPATFGHPEATLHLIVSRLL